MTKEFYDSISKHYARDRYESDITQYVQFVYAQRLSRVRRFARDVFSRLHDASVLDVGTADGFVLRKIYDDNQCSIDSMTGIDISPEMLREAQQHSIGYPVRYLLREEHSGTYDVIFEIGVHLSDPEAECAWLAHSLAPGGSVILSVANRRSLYSVLKLRNKPYAREYRTFQEYETVLRRHFDIVDVSSLGLFIPMLWKLPKRIAYIVQTMAEYIASVVAPSRMHERLYLLRQRSS